MSTFGVYIILFLACLYSPAAAIPRPKMPCLAEKQSSLCDATPTDFKQSYLSNCLELQLGCRSMTCSQAWNEFSGAFARRDPATVVNE